MDLVTGVRRVVVMMEHTSRDGRMKLLKQCSLPLTGTSVVNRVITNLGVFDIGEQGLSVIEIAAGVSLDEICKKTEPKLLLATMTSCQGEHTESHEETAN